MSKASPRVKTDYPGVYYRMARRIGGRGEERVYYITFKKEGKTIEEKVGRQYVDDLTPARAAGIRAERVEGKRKSRKEIKAALEAEQGNVTIGKLWIEFSRQKGGQKSFRDDKCRWEKHLSDYFAKKEPSKLVTLDIDRLRLRLKKSGLSPQTAKHVIVLLKRIINFGVRRGLCPLPDPSRLHFEMPKVNNEVTEDLTPKQLQALLKALDESTDIQAAHLMKMALFTGMRRGELFRLKWEHIDFERGHIRIVTPKGGKDQSIPLGKEAAKLLKSHIRTGSPYVFPGRGGNQRTDIRKQVARIKEAANLPKSFRPLHGLRHVYASMLASSGKVDMYTLQKLLTHKSPQMTQRYAHLRDEALKKAAGTADELFSAMNG